ncbi:phage holin family protein [Paenactinomyces guangxiensis]|uniref:Phage holin family protein n=1 Tax=Paenactinomyces guangxiensis TaxID=1490290 RepID=A0A7W1WR64_9BACL|nr:phage holin family protein [Paenactinomyces guangxiensis]MBA4494556.1 phage holin family protein [Paenactinomyces guangxiensis]MBH8591681.1 phage holin family protein [Paenactinomyces guangxiensis]
MRHFIRFLSCLSVLLLVNMMVPGFSSNGLIYTCLAALVITVTSWFIETLLGRDISPFARGVIGMGTTALILLLAPPVIPAFQTRLLGIILSALLVGFIDIFVPVGARFTTK